MAKSNKVVKAMERLSSAVEALEKSIDSRMERESILVDSEAEVQRLGADRTRLAVSLDDAEAKSVRLEQTNKEVSRRLVDAMETIRTVLDQKQE